MLLVFHRLNSIQTKSGISVRGKARSSPFGKGIALPTHQLSGIKEVELQLLKAHKRAQVEGQFLSSLARSSRETSKRQPVLERQI
jgi:hypothetical protein